MAKLPTAAFFTCESCGKQLRTDDRMGNRLIPAMRRLAIRDNGKCKHCDGDLWTLTVVYEETSLDTEASAVGIGLSLTTGVGFTQSSTSSNQSHYSSLPAAVVAKLNDEPKVRMQRITELATTIERGKLVAAGGKSCLSCGVLFAPAEHKSWHTLGYCSPVCAPRSLLDASENEGESSEPFATEVRQTVEVQCANGHDFAVAKSFIGLKRPCPTCKVKTLIESPKNTG